MSKVDLTEPPPKLTGLTYRRKWGLTDFVGKYHLSKIAHKETPIPGTIINIEKKHEEKKDADLKRFEAELKYRSDYRHERNIIKNQMSEISTRVYFDTVLGTPIDEIQTCVDTRVAINNDHKPKVGDSAKDIAKFMKNIRLGRHHYVGFAVVMGYRSLDCQDETGNTALHIAVRNGNFPRLAQIFDGHLVDLSTYAGHLECIEELLKYKANPDIKNNLGYNPAHNAWLFWNTDKYRTKEQRIDQEERTREILRLIFAYGGYVDCQDQYGEVTLQSSSIPKGIVDQRNRY